MTVDPTGESVASVSSTAMRGGAALVVRQLLVQIVGFLAAILLARWLSPSIFGIFTTATTIVGVFAFFCDFGLGTSLIRQKSQVTEEQMSTLFTLQTTFAVALVVLIWPLAPYVVSLWRNVPHESVWLVRALSIQLLLRSFRGVQLVALERNLRFGVISGIEFLEQVVYYAVAVGLARLVPGAWCLVIAVVARAIVGTALMFTAAQRLPTFQFHGKHAAELIRFGGSMQVLQVALFASSLAMPYIVGSYCGVAALGFASWAYGNAYRPMQIVEHVWRIALPTIGRFQDDPAIVNRALERAVYLLSVVFFLYAAIWFGLGAVVVKVIYTAKWLPGLTALHVFLVGMYFAILASLVDIFSVATGRPGLAARVQVLRAIAAWVVGVPLTMRFGIAGFAVSTIVASALHFLVELLYFARGTYRVAWSRSAGVPFFSALLAVGVARLLIVVRAPSAPLLALGGVLVFLTFSGTVFILDREYARAYLPIHLLRTLLGRRVAE